MRVIDLSTYFVGSINEMRESLFMHEKFYFDCYCISNDFNFVFLHVFVLTRCGDILPGKEVKFEF